MPSKEQQRQKKLARKRSKEVAKRKQQAREKSVMQSLAGQMKAASGGSFDRCYMSDDLFEANSRLGAVFISRFLPDGRVACARFLVDAFCLGVKDIHAFVTYPSNLTEYIERSEQVEPLKPCATAKAKKFVEGSVEYARKFGIEPHADYRKVEPIWTGIEASECTESFQYGGDNGKPRYVNGPHDSPLFQQRILEKLQTHAGEGNYDFVMMAGGSDAFGEIEDGGWMDDPELDADIDEDVVDGRVIE
ncbi:hypothetical protein CA13_43800 [Planctomycetes bacterium CA13]|uniref:Uncharacterized protein n=1 Tax=Novipirellula herctigrandis TaxID=2527986 RepID=A0A5C5Z775_9BACT|nr:hypothetical protein CA13_43800 [Planctomycetes bacterium CA13]